MAKRLRVFSLFDGMSGARIALMKAGIDVGRFFSSEVDKYAMQIANKNFPEDSAFRVGDVQKVNGEMIPKIDLLIGGSPCQNFSFGGMRNGMSTKSQIEIRTLSKYLKLKEEGFQFDGQSYLFWEYIRVLKETKPKYFLLENVSMAKKWKDVITKAIGVEPIEINSSLVSGQNRKRLYWTNIPGVTAPEDKGISLSDVMDDIEIVGGIDNPNVEMFKNCVRKNIIAEYPLVLGSSKMIQTVSCTSGFQDNKVGILKSPTLRAGNNFTLGLKGNIVRRLTVKEWEELQTVPFGYTEGVSNSQRTKMIGNGFTIDVIAHILSFIPEL